jgi:hypothetical protein
MKNFLVFAFGLISVSGFCQKDPEGFVLVKSDPPIEVHERWVDFPGKMPVITSRELKSEFTTSASIYYLLVLIKEETHVKNWQSRLSEYKVYSRDDTTLWDAYSVYDAPWPVDDQDSFMEYKLTEVRPGEEIHINFKSRVDDTLAPLYEDITRIELMGSWKLVRQPSGLIKVTYRLQSAPVGRALPRMVVDPVIRSNLLSSMRSLKELSEK